MRWANFFHIYQPHGWDEDVVRRVAAESYEPFIAILRRHPNVRVTIHIAGALTERLLSLGMNDIIQGLKELVNRGQVELTAGAMYHPILPLIPVDEVKRQIDLQDEYHRRIFGSAYAPRGFFSPEMAYSQVLEPILLERGYRWIILDEIALDGRLDHVTSNTRYTTPDGLGVVFRHRELSDFLAFRADVNHPDNAIQAIIKDRRGQRGFVTAMDGEMLGHHRHGVDRLWQMLVARPEVEAVTVSEFRDGLGRDESVTPLQSSWSSQVADVAGSIPFGLWKHPDNAIHQLQWQLTHLAIQTVTEAINDPAYDTVRPMLDQNLSSDKFWWASASPWWDPGIIIRETQKLADVIAPLQTIKTSIKNEAERLMKSLATTVEVWDRTGIARRRQQTYLHTTRRVHYMAGRPVS